jgi:hypothetical protein
MKATADDYEAMTRKLSLLAAMLFPQERKSRYDFIDAVFGKAAQSLLSKRVHESLAPDDAIWLFKFAQFGPQFEGLSKSAFRVVRRNRPTRPLQNEETHGPVLAGSIAATALLIPLICNLKYGKQHVGLHQSFRVMLGSGDTNDPTGFRNLQKVWNYYRPVAHLWAAWDLFDYEVGNTLEEVTAFVSLGRIISDWGKQYTPLRASKPILDGDIRYTPNEWVTPLTLPLDDVDINAAAKAVLLG